jgi:hypothetical protein
MTPTPIDEGLAPSSVPPGALPREVPGELQTRFRVGVAMLNAAEFFEQHEVFEEIWQAEPGPIRELFQGLLQIGVGCLHVQRGNPRGAISLLERGVARLGRVAPDAGGLDVALFRLQAWQLRQALARSLTGTESGVELPRFPRAIWLKSDRTPG